MHLSSSPSAAPPPLISCKAVRFRARRCTAGTREASSQPENTCLLPRTDYLKMCELATHCHSLPSKARRGFAVIRRLLSGAPSCPSHPHSLSAPSTFKEAFIYRMPLAWRTSCSISSGASSIVIVVRPWAYWRGLKVFFSFFLSGMRDRGMRQRFSKWVQCFLPLSRLFCPAKSNGCNCSVFLTCSTVTGFQTFMLALKVGGHTGHFWSSRFSTKGLKYHCKVKVSCYPTFTVQFSRLPLTCRWTPVILLLHHLFFGDTVVYTYIIVLFSPCLFLDTIQCTCIS